MNTRYKYYLLTLIALMASCAAGTEQRPDKGDPSYSEQTRFEAEKEKTRSKDERTDNENSKENNRNSSLTPANRCLDVDTGDKFLLKAQTFPIDFKPFENSCFVTAYDPEYEDPPLGCEISIYRDGKKIYGFDSRYNPDAATCWVEGVSFEDLSGDGLTDIIVAGKCGAKSGPIQGNEVFINTGKEFYTNIEANDRLENFSNLKDIAKFVRKNKQLFSVR